METARVNKHICMVFRSRAQGTSFSLSLSLTVSCASYGSSLPSLKQPCGRGAWCRLFSFSSVGRSKASPSQTSPRTTAPHSWICLPRWATKFSTQVCHHDKPANMRCKLAQPKEYKAHGNLEMLYSAQQNCFPKQYSRREEKCEINEACMTNLHSSHECVEP